MKFGERATAWKAAALAKARADLKLIADELDGKSDGEFDVAAFNARMRAMGGQSKAILAVYMVGAIIAWEIIWFAVPLLWSLI